MILTTVPRVCRGKWYECEMLRGTTALMVDPGATHRAFMTYRVVGRSWGSGRILEALKKLRSEKALGDAQTQTKAVFPHEALLARRTLERNERRN